MLSLRHPSTTIRRQKATPLIVSQRSTVCTVLFCVLAIATDLLLTNVTQIWLPSGITASVLAVPSNAAV
jgi:hypothetical protein